MLGVLGGSKDSMTPARWVNWGLEAAATWGLALLLILLLCSLWKSLSAFLFICKQKFLILQKPLVALQYILQIICRLMNEPTEWYHFTKSFYTRRDSVSELHYQWTEFDLWHTGYQNIKNAKKWASLKKAVLCVFMHLGGRRLLRGKKTPTNPNAPTKQTATKTLRLSL